MCVYVCGDQKSLSGVILRNTAHLWSVADLELTKGARLSGH